MKSLPVSGVVRRVDVDQLHFAGVALLQQLQHLEVVALDHQVSRRVLGPRSRRGRVARCRCWASGPAGARRACHASSDHASRRHRSSWHRRPRSRERRHRRPAPCGRHRAAAHLRFGHEFREQRLQTGEVDGAKVGTLRFRCAGCHLFYSHRSGLGLSNVLRSPYRRPARPTSSQPQATSHFGAPPIARITRTTGIERPASIGR